MRLVSNSRFARLLFAALALCAGSDAGDASAQGTKTEVFAQPLVEPGTPSLILEGATKSAATQGTRTAYALRAQGALRSRAAMLDIGALRKIGAKPANGKPHLIHVSFFADVSLVLEIARVERVGSNGTAYSGGVAGIPRSSAVIVEQDGIVSADVMALDKRYEIRNFGDADHVLRQIDPRAFPPDHDVAVPTIAARSQNFTPPVAVRSAAADDGSIIDVMVVYTPAARISQGSTAAMNSLVNLGIAQTNAAYANSGVTQRVRLVYAGEVSYTEVDFATDRDRLQGTTDRFMDEVHQLRNLYGADLVSLWGNYSGACGLAYPMLNESASFEALGFSVVDRNCATSNYSFAHELGHNMGLQHDTFDGNSGTTVTPEGSAVPTAINYAHGYVDVANRFRTVMAISAQCDAQMPPIDCLRIPYFSNPGVSVDNRPFFPAAAASAPTGNAYAFPIASSQEFKALNDTRETTANFRMSVDLSGPGTIIFLPLNYSVSEAAGFVTLSVARHAGSNGVVSVAYATSNGTATAGADFTTKAGTLTWANGEAGTKTITIPILQDGVLEGPETFSVMLDTPTGGVSIGAPGGNSSVATVTIIDADTDSFPPGCMAPLTGWTNPPTGAAAGWAVATDTFFGPACSLKSNPLTAGAAARIEFSGEFTQGTLSFARRVSSQSGSDCLRFTIDGVQQNIGGTCSAGLGASGETAWGVVSFPIAAGMHTLTWSYEKGNGGTAGADAAWIDSVVLPLGGPPAIVSAPPPEGFLNIPYFHTFTASGTPPVTYTLQGTFLPAGLVLSPGGIISGTPTLIDPRTISVRASNNILPFDQKIYSINIVALPPGAPAIKSATAGNRQASVAFDPPVSEGSAPVTGYTATCSPGVFAATGSASPITLTQLDNGTEYTCSVTATNNYGTGATSAPLLVTPRTTRPDTPVIGTPAPGNSQAFIAFTPPVADGGSPITAYTVTCNPGAITGTAAFAPVTVTNLTNGTAYTCSVTATNAVGTSVASASATVTPSASPTLSLVGAVSRKSHGVQGTFDLPVDISAPINGNITVEPRVIGSGHTLLLRFNSAITTTGGISVRDGAGLSVGASAIPSGNDVQVTIPFLADRKRVTVTLTGVNGALNPPPVAVGFLTGDVNNTRTVNASDINAVKLRSGLAAGGLTFKFDVDGSGVVDSADVSVVKARSGTVLP